MRGHSFDRPPRDAELPVGIAPFRLESSELRARLEAVGCRWTKQRQAIYDYLSGQESHHPTADEVFHGVRPGLPDISLATIYKGLEGLEACGLVTKLPPDRDGAARFDARPEQHYHLRCLKTGEVRDLPTPFDPDLIDRLDPGLRERLAAEGFQLAGYRLELIGRFADGDE